MGAKRVSKQGVTVSEGNAIEVTNTAGTALFSVNSTGNINTLANLTAKGSILTASAANTPATLAVGANGYTLVADSSTSTGLAYSPTFFAGKNKFINGDFSIWQRGTSFTTLSSVYWADRWVVDAGISAGSRTISQQTFTAGTAPVAGYEGAYFARYAVSGATISSQNIQQRIEDVRTLAGQTVTLSFWAKADASRTITPYYQQNFGSGGSGAVSASVGTANLTTSWQRFTFTFSMPSISGKTIGTSSFLTIFLDLPTTATATYDFWGFQLEAGSTATQFQTATGTIQGEFAACQRYYYRPTTGLYTQYGVGFAASTTQVDIFVQHPVTMRVAPSFSQSATKVFDGNGFITPSGVTTTDATTYSTNIRNTVTGATQFRPYKQSNDNNANAYIELSAEL